MEQHQEEMNNELTLLRLRQVTSQTQVKSFVSGLENVLPKIDKLSTAEAKAYSFLSTLL